MGMTPFIREIPGKDPQRIFASLEHLPYSLWLDSADPTHPTGRYSFIVTHPIETIEARDGVITITNWDKQEKREGADPFTVVQERLKHWIPETETVRGFPSFQGGAAGFFGYDLARGLEKLPENAARSGEVPDMAIGIYDQVLTFDHQKKQAWMITHANNYHDARRKQDYILGLIANAPLPHTYEDAALEWISNFEDKTYKDAVAKVIRYIRAGDIFQANLAQRFTAELPKNFDSFSHYLHLRKVNPAPFAAYMNCGMGIKISSASPERFLGVKDSHVETRPIKGTQPRSKNPAEDLKNRERLEASQKDHAENTMIVDLMRNDLSKVCKNNSVNVSALCQLESFASVHHLVSVISGTLEDNKTALDLLKACFPGGSITGAPKVRAMEIIEEIEDNRRGPYCGAMAYIGFDGTMDSSILIRTLVYDGEKVSLSAGGGIVSDSVPEEEYQETLDKAFAMLRSFGTKTEKEAQSERLTA